MFSIGEEITYKGGVYVFREEYDGILFSSKISINIKSYYFDVMNIAGFAMDFFIDNFPNKKDEGSYRTGIQVEKIPDEVFEEVSEEKYVEAVRERCLGMVIKKVKEIYSPENDDFYFEELKKD